MNFDFTEEQLAIADMANSLFQDTCTDQYLRDYDENGQGTMKDIWSSSIETGLHGVIIPEEHGGIGLGMNELSLVLQAQAGALAQVPLWRHQVATTAIALFSGDTDYSGLIESAASGDTLLTLANDFINTAAVSVLSATENKNGYELNGNLKAVAVAQIADTILLPLDLDGTRRWAVLDSKKDGMTLVNGQMTHGEEVADIHFTKVQIASSALLEQKADNWITPRILACLSALQLGVSEEQIKKTVEYVSQRKQFDRAIGSFQAVQMTMADTKILLEALRSNVWQLCYRLDNNLSVEHEAYATAWHACDAGHKIGHAAQHVHGGFGVDVSYIIFRYLYWSRAISLNLGGAPALLTKLGDVLSNNHNLGWKYDLDENYAN